jgi:putative ABC transport system permease protein
LVVQRQIGFALNEGLRFDKEQLLAIKTSCQGAFLDEVRRLPGVRAAACSDSMPLQRLVTVGEAFGPDGTYVSIRNDAIAPGLMEMLGVHPLAGRFFSPDHPEESQNRRRDSDFAGPIIINETALRRFHFRSPQAALGQVLRHQQGPQALGDASQIIGVAPDVPLGSVRYPVEPTVYNSDAGNFRMMAVKLAGRQVPETLSAIDALWKNLGEPRPINRVFVDQELQELYLGDVRQGQMFTAFAGIALLIACLGLLGLAAFTAERRTKEIGVRKAMGASHGQIMRMLLWELTRPVLVANLVAWPVSLYLMSRWLAGFTYHITLSWWMFLASGLLALLVAWVTVSTHAFLVARARPATALRYE